ncbi:hypothetical protein UPYG_G00131600 [Umbra pygmaea]|uniref:Zinc transporter ZIP9 n=1 Tax=Umbra pygmaea TaxID=75934 RepID=A0ABD0XBR6_UMBPY
MDEAIAIILISLAMFFGCFLLGLIPLLFKLSEKSLKFVSIFGAGLLCGTALAIIIPEGVELLLESVNARPCSSMSAPAANQNASDSGVRGQNAGEGDLPSKGLPVRFFIGVSLVVGFTLMFLVEQLSSYCSINDPRTGMSNRTSLTATLGLVIHAAADGVALGAAVASSQVTVQVMVFLAVILHKAPAAFGLVSFLMHAGLEKQHIQKHLLAFSAAAPVLAISTYFTLNASGGSSQHRLSAIGIGMLFSAGTFLYVATVHVLPEISISRQQQHNLPHIHQHGTGQQVGLGITESLTLILGAGLPVLLALGLHD